MNGPARDLRSTAGFVEADDKPRNIAVRHIIDSCHLPHVVEEVLIDNNSHFFAPTTERRHFDLELWHKTLWSAASVIRTARHRWEWCCFLRVFDHVVKIELHFLPREVDGLYLDGAPLQWFCLWYDQNIVDSPYTLFVFSRLLPAGKLNTLEKIDLANRNCVRFVQDRLPDPLENNGILLESRRACDADGALALVELHHFRGPLVGS